MGDVGFLLLEYFSQHLGEYENVLSVLEDLNITILKAMDKTKKVSKTVTISLHYIFYLNMYPVFFLSR